MSRACRKPGRHVSGPKMDGTDILRSQYSHFTWRGASRCATRGKTEAQLPKRVSMS
jgi:hypothetical protein